jgi:hypothetical protein
MGHRVSSDWNEALKFQSEKRPFIRIAMGTPVIEDPQANRPDEAHDGLNSHCLHARTRQSVQQESKLYRCAQDSLHSAHLSVELSGTYMKLSD